MPRLHDRRLLWLLTPCFLVLPFAAAHAATYYVSPTGNDGNSGSASSPWRSLQKAANTVRAGDVVLAANGTYAGMSISADGTASAPITFRANGSDVVVNAPYGQKLDNIDIDGGNHVIVEGFVVEDAPRNGIRAVVATGVKIRDNTIRRSGLTGILAGFTPSIEVSGNSSSGNLGEHGIYVSNSSTTADNPVIRGNECFDNNRSGIQVNGDCFSGGDGVITGALIENNVVHDNQLKGLSLISMQGSTVRNNLVYDNGLSGTGAAAIHLADEPNCGKPSNGNIVVNNTIHDSRLTGIRLSNGSTDNTIFNNLIVVSSLSRAIDDEGSGNTIDGTTNVKLTSTTGVFVSAGTGDYHLVPQSVAIERAASTFDGVSAPTNDAAGMPRPQGVRPDAGAFEFTAPTMVGEMPASFVVLGQNAPNPFNPTTRIAYEVASAIPLPVRLDVFDVHGRLVRRLLDKRSSSGRGEVVWDGRDEYGQTVSSGVYFYRLQAGMKTLTRRMTLLK